MKNIFAIYGASGFGRETLPLLKQQILSEDMVCFVDDSPNIASQINGIPVFAFDDFCSLPYQNKYISIAISNSQIREKLASKCLASNIGFYSIKANNVVILDKVLIDEGTILSNFVTLTSNIKIGKQFHANIYSYIAHDCVIGDYVTFAPGVKCNGNVHIGNHVYIGAGAIIKQGTPDRPIYIGDNAIIGMGAVVMKDVLPGQTVMGNPAIPLRDFLRKNK